MRVIGDNATLSALRDGSGRFLTLTNHNLRKEMMKLYLLSAQFEVMSMRHGYLGFHTVSRSHW